MILKISQYMDFFVLVSLEHGLSRIHSFKDPKNCDEEVRWKTAQDNALVNYLVPTIIKLSAICLTEIATQGGMKSLSILC